MWTWNSEQDIEVYSSQSFAVACLCLPATCYFFLTLAPPTTTSNKRYSRASLPPVLQIAPPQKRHSNAWPAKPANPKNPTCGKPVCDSTFSTDSRPQTAKAWSSSQVRPKRAMVAELYTRKPKRPMCFETFAYNLYI